MRMQVNASGNGILVVEVAAVRFGGLDDPGAILLVLPECLAVAGGKLFRHRDGAFLRIDKDEIAELADLLEFVGVGDAEALK